MKRFYVKRQEKKPSFWVNRNGYFDLTAYMSYNEGTMTDYIPTDKDLEKGFASIPKIDL